MQRVERTARIPAPPSEVFAYLSNLDNLAEWQSGIISAERVDDGPMRVGSSARVTRELMGQRLDVPLTITDYEPPARLGIASEVSGVKAAAMLDLAAADDGTATEVSFAMEIRGSGMTSFMEPMIASAAKGDIEASLARLTARFSAEPT
ncbi:MAG TPA: SRPBCC family protein [Candidatus Binatia bacterium]|nr:SRPBCC family protein [Candidatus Binatia bacterium]